MDEIPRLGFSAALAFFCELFMYGLLVATGHQLAAGWTGWILGVVLAGATVWVWARWMAPTSQLRLPRRRRLLAEIILFAAVGGLALLAGLAWWGMVFFIIATFAFTNYPQ